jgi:hypothetical protein
MRRKKPAHDAQADAPPFRGGPVVDMGHLATLPGYVGTVDDSGAAKLLWINSVHAKS